MDAFFEKSDKKNILIAGSGGHARIIIDIIESQSEYNISGIITNETINTFEGYPVLGDDSILPTLRSKGEKNIVIGVGGFTNNNLRKKLFEKYKSLGFIIPTLIHSNAYVSAKAKLGEAVVVCSGCSIMPCSVLEDNVVVYTNSSIDHESMLEKHVLISAGVTVGAYSLIQEESLIALGAKIVSGVKIGKNVLVAAGAVVTTDISNQKKVFGIPAKSKN